MGRLAKTIVVLSLSLLGCKDQRAPSVSHAQAGDMLVAQGDLPGDLASLRKELAIAEQRAAADPSSAQAQRDLSIIREKVEQARRATKGGPVRRTHPGDGTGK